MPVSHFLTLDDIPAQELSILLNRAIELKALHASGEAYSPLTNQSLALIFDKASTRTRVSFEVGMRQLGGGALNLTPNDTQIGRGEPIEDTARVISSMVDGIVIRTDTHEKLTRFAQYSTVPVINGLTDDVHPCQLLADLMTLQELRGGYEGATVAWIGDGNNVCHSWMNAARIFNFHLHIACPAEFMPADEFLQKNGESITVFNQADEAAENVDVIVTDTWASMGQEAEKKTREHAFRGYCVDERIMGLAKANALFMHCLPAYRGMEVTDSVIEGSQSVVFQEAENRLHAQKALLEKLLSKH